jgi:hypothetical protein
MIAIVSTIVILAASGALALYGYRSVAGDLDEVIRIVRGLVATASANVLRQTASRGEITVVFDPPRHDQSGKRTWLVVAEAPDAELEPKSQLIESSERPSEVHFSLRTSKAASTKVAVSIYEADTLTPVGRLDAFVPSANEPNLLMRAVRSVVARW